MTRETDALTDDEAHVLRSMVENETRRRGGTIWTRHEEAFLARGLTEIRGKSNGMDVHWVTAKGHRLLAAQASTSPARKGDGS